MVGKVERYVMSEEERLAYIEKHPIIKRERPKGLHSYEWRGQKGNESRYGKKKNGAE